MRNIFKFLSVALVLTIATQSFSMFSRLSRIATRRLPAQRALVRAALKPNQAAKTHLANAAASRIKVVATQPVAKAQLRNFASSAPMRIQNLGQQEQESQGNQNSFKSTHARLALGGLAALTGAGIVLYSEPAKADGAEKSIPKILHLRDDYKVDLVSEMQRHCSILMLVAIAPLGAIQHLNDQIREYSEKATITQEKRQKCLDLLSKSEERHKQLHEMSSQAIKVLVMSSGKGIRTPHLALQDLTEQLKSAASLSSITDDSFKLYHEIKKEFDAIKQ